MKAKVVSVGDNLPGGWVLLTLAIQTGPQIWAPHTAPVQLPGRWRPRPHDEIEVEYVDPEDYTKGFYITKH